MTAHPESHTHEDTTLHADPKLELAKSLKFEPSELVEFSNADKSAGQMMGKLLGFLFCVLLFLMTGVNIWMMSHSSDINDKDPQAFAYGESGGHAAAAHH
jgi:hypothetical protein